MKSSVAHMRPEITGGGKVRVEAEALCGDETGGAEVEAQPEEEKKGAELPLYEKIGMDEARMIETPGVIDPRGKAT